MIVDRSPRPDATSGALASDFGWGDADEGSSFGGVGSAALLFASSAAWLASVWVVHGLPPFHRIALRMGSVERSSIEHGQ